MVMSRSLTETRSFLKPPSFLPTGILTWSKPIEPAVSVPSSTQPLLYLRALAVGAEPAVGVLAEHLHARLALEVGPRAVDQLELLDEVVAVQGDPIGLAVGVDLGVGQQRLHVAVLVDRP